MSDKTRTRGDKDSSKSNDDPTETTGDTMRRSRRRLIQILTAGGVVTSARLVPAEWARPVIESVSLPAHAQTTGEVEVIVLGNDGVAFGDRTPDSERPESLLASGVETMTDLLDRITQAARAGEDFQDDAIVGCNLTGCFRIRYVKGQTNGVLFVSTADFSTDSLDTDEITRPFVDGVNGSFAGTCLENLYDGYRVDLKNDNLAELHIFIAAGKSLDPIDLVKNFNCNPLRPS
jgi:hypothetical protein